MDFSNKTFKMTSFLLFFFFSDWGGDGIVYTERELSVRVCLKVYVGGVKVCVTAKLSVEKDAIFL